MCGPTLVMAASLIVHQTTLQAQCLWLHPHRHTIPNATACTTGTTNQKRSLRCDGMDRHTGRCKLDDEAQHHHHHHHHHHHGMLANVTTCIPRSPRPLNPHCQTQQRPHCYGVRVVHQPVSLAQYSQIHVKHRQR
jgi:hypothetical protein